MARSRRPRLPPTFSNTPFGRRARRAYEAAQARRERAAARETAQRETRARDLARAKQLRKTGALRLPKGVETRRVPPATLRRRLAAYDRRQPLGRIPLTGGTVSGRATINVNGYDRRRRAFTVNVLSTDAEHIHQLLAAGQPNEARNYMGDLILRSKDLVRGSARGTQGIINRLTSVEDDIEIQ